MDQRELEGVLESVLFAAGNPVSAEQLCIGLEINRKELEDTVQTLMKRYRCEQRGIRLVQMEDSYQLCSAPEYASYILKTLERRKTARLSQTALEVLTVIAYFQPITRAYIDQLRGVDSSYTIGLLLERELICECGRLAVPGRPILYQTTQNFLRTFGISSLDELPEMPETSAEHKQTARQLEHAVESLKQKEQSEVL